MTRQRKPAPPEQRAGRRLPELRNREELAQFWDTHDISDYWDELKPVSVRATKGLSAGITVRLDRETLAKLRRQAHEQGIGPTTLIRMWILERLREQERRSAAG